ncbi:MAG: Chloride/fluoride channel protein [Turneriella sp.]|nr:Chloride/fluoride channel protein [Turneriella sp.]
MGRQFFRASFNTFEHFFIFQHIIKWTLLAIPVALSVGSIVALFLWLLDRVTVLRIEHGWLLFLLPLAGVFIFFIYKFAGKNAEAGNNLIMEEIHEPGGGVPLRMTPLVLSTTIITHLFGGSAGREGTAVQMGGSLAGLFGRWFSLDKEDLRVMLTIGVAAGFGAVFGTPLTGAIFALEVLTIGRINHNALLPCFIASFFADLTCTAWGIGHTHYHISPQIMAQSAMPFIKIDYLLLLKVIMAGVCFGLVGYLFSEISHFIKYLGQKVPHKWLVPVIGALFLIALTYALGTRDFLGIGVGGNGAQISITSAFASGGAENFSWFWKFILTAITLGTGFKGGEVTPLFFIGATLGNVIGNLTGAPIDLMAGLGFIAVFAGATNTPIACTLMGVELFGGEHILYFAVACFTAYYFSGHSGIYHSQRLGTAKTGKQTEASDQTLRSISIEKTERRGQWLRK